MATAHTSPPEPNDRAPYKSGTGRRGPTIHDVALRCGVAASTVSRAFSHPERVNSTTRERILSTATEMGYRPSPIARALPSGRTMTLALLVPDITNPFFFGIIRAAERQAAAAGYTLVLADTNESAEAETASVTNLARAVDGFVLSSSRLPVEVLRQVHAKVPLVVVNRKVPGIPSVVIEASDGIRQVTEHLASLGHRSIVYIAGPRTSWSDARRWKALQTSARRLDIEVTRIGPFAPTLAAGAPAADAALLEDATAIVTFNDLLAIGVLCRLAARGITVPDELSVVGCDDSFGSDFCHPPLTTLAAPVEDAGRVAVDLLLVALRSGPEELARPVVLPSHLKIRDSTAAATR